MPSAGRCFAAPAKVGGNRRSELVDLATNGFEAHLDAALRPRFLDVPNTQGEAEMQPDRMSDRIRREPVTFGRDWRDNLLSTGHNLGYNPETS